MNAWRNRAMMQRQRCLDKSGDTGGAFGVTDIRLDRTDIGAASRRPTLAEDRAECREFDRVAHPCAGAMGLDVSHPSGGHRRIVVGGTQQLLLT